MDKFLTQEMEGDYMVERLKTRTTLRRALQLLDSIRLVPSSASPTYEISLLVKGKSSGGKNYFSSIHVGSLGKICVASSNQPILLINVCHSTFPCRFRFSSR